MPVKIFCNLCGGEIEGPVVKVVAYSEPVSTDEDAFLKGAGEPDEFATTFAHPACAAHLREEIMRAIRGAPDALEKPTQNSD